MNKDKKKIEELELEIERLKKERKYGLIWEEHKEENETADYKMERIKSLDINANKSEVLKHKIIEGDNLLALRELQKTHKGKVDVIYIDPPYNTGREFIYKDKYTNKGDEFFHSKWLNFLFIRLNLAKQLLTREGIIFISIDNNEQAHLKILMDRVFGRENFIDLIVRRTRKGGRANSFLSREYDLIYIYSKNIKQIKGFRKRKVVGKTYSYRDKVRGEYNLRSLERDNSNKSESMIYTINDKKGNEYKSEKGWRWGRGKVKWGIENNYIVFKNSRVYYKEYRNYDNRGEFKEENEVNFSNLWTETEHYNARGTASLREIFGEAQFDFPKPPETIKKLIKLVNNKEMIILDFFAGSGTTGQAVMELNKEDGGNRQFILCTNNEVSEERLRNYLFNIGKISKPNKSEFKRFTEENNLYMSKLKQSEEYQQLGIARSVTHPRIKKVIEGYITPKGEEISGLNENAVSYYKVSSTKEEPKIE